MWFQGHISQLLAAHIKIHKQKTFKCSKCEYKCTTLTKLNAHKKDHIEVISDETALAIVNDIDSENTPLINKMGKRDLSISPEGIGTDKKTSEILKSRK